MVVEGAVESLHLQRELLNSLNLFPVPDGDTGINMYLTLAGGLREMEKTPFSTVPEALQDLSLGALQESRGNSGIILAQFLDGIAKGLSKTEEPEMSDLLDGFEIGVEAVYSAVQNPVEGTILTVVREMVEGLRDYRNSSSYEFVCTAYKLASDSLIRNRGMLDKYIPGEITPINTIDAGAAGLIIAFEGSLSSVGIEVEKLHWSDFVPRYSFTEYDGPKWDLRFTVDCDGRKLGELRTEMSVLGESFVLAGSSSPYNIHIHTGNPETVLNAAGSYGSISGIEATEMFSTFDGSGRELPKKYQPTSVIAFSSGLNLQGAFKEMGAEVLGLQTETQFEMSMLWEMISQLNCGSVIILPNYPHLLNNVSDVARSYPGKAVVIPTESPVAGLAAMEEYFDNGNPADVIEKMKKAAFSVMTGSIVLSGNRGERNTTLQKHKFLGTAEGKEVCIEEDLSKAAIEVCKALSRDTGGGILTFIAGDGLNDGDITKISDKVTDFLPDHEQEWYDGGFSEWLLFIGLE